MPPPPRLLLIAQEGQARQVYASALDDIGISVDVVSDIESFYHAITHTPYSAILVDIPTKILALKDHQDLVHSILSHYPVIQLNIDRYTGRIRALRLGQHQTGGSLGELLSADYLLASPVLFREHRRQKLHFNVLISDSLRFEPDKVVRSVTIDVSRGGCFLYYADDRPLPDRIWIRFNELSDPSPIGAKIRNRIPWGDSMRIPGVGVQFEVIGENQLEEIEEAAVSTGEPKSSPSKDFMNEVG
ncbi:MAG: PilZ domain-containing protein [Desulfobacterales bacterium]